MILILLFLFIYVHVILIYNLQQKQNSVLQTYSAFRQDGLYLCLPHRDVVVVQPEVFQRRELAEGWRDLPRDVVVEQIEVLQRSQQAKRFWQRAY